MPTEAPSFDDLSREQIYDLVWTTPMASLAEQYHVTDVALKKRCRRLSIPTPGRGYWAKIAHGQTPKRMPLPATIGTAQPQVPASAHHSQWPKEVRGLCDRAQAFATELREGKPNYRKLQELQSKAFPHAQVSEACVDAAARLFHALLVVLEDAASPSANRGANTRGATSRLRATISRLKSMKS